MPNHPTPEQLAILSTTAPVLLIDACAGSGKTTTLAMLARHAVEKRMAPGRIACLSFSASANRRFAAKLHEEGAPPTVRTKTLQGFAQDILAALVRQGQLVRPRQLKTADEVRQRLLDACDIVWKRHEADEAGEFDFGFENNMERLDQLLAVLDQLKASLWTHRFDDDEFGQEDIDTIVEEFNIPGEIVEICMAHERRRQSVPGDFAWQTEADTIPDLLRLLEIHGVSGLMSGSLPTLSLMLVDEWHDINTAEFALIGKLRRQARLVAVGDRDQVINQERGAALRFSTGEFDAAYPDHARLPLRQSRRFGPSLAREASRFASRPCEAIGELHTTLYQLHYDPEVEGACARAVAEKVRQLYAPRQDTEWSDIAIVVREEDQSIDIENALLDKDIPYRCDGISSYLLRPEILMLRALLHIAGDDFGTLRDEPDTTGQMVTALAMYVSMSRDPNDWESDYLSTDTTGKSNDILEQAKQFIAKDPSILASFFSGVLCRVHDYDKPSTSRWKQDFALFVDDMKAADRLGASDLLRLADERLNLAAATRRAFLRASHADTALRSIRAFIAFSARYPDHSPKQFLDELAQRQRKAGMKTTTGKRRPQLSLATIQAAKGLEWRHVVVPKLQRGEFPRGADFDEEKRFLYVAMTRARDSLTIAEPDEDHRQQRSPLLHGPRARRCVTPGYRV